LSRQTLFLLAVTLPLLVALSTLAGLGCSEGSCGILATIVDALWLPLIAAWLIVLVLLMSGAKR
jgi:hypothetical protein